MHAVADLQPAEAERTSRPAVNRPRAVAEPTTPWGSSRPARPSQVPLARRPAGAETGGWAAARAAGKLPPGLEHESLPITGTGSGSAATASPPATPAPSPAPTPSPAPAPAPAPAAATPPKLSYKTVNPATGADCGGFSWTVQWLLDKPSPLGGWVVQRVDVARDVKDCAGKPVATGGIDPSWYPLWEAWQIHKGQKVTTYAEGGDLDDDSYGQGPIPSTKGSYTVTGSAQFYEGLTLPADFKVTNKAPTWILPTTKAAPTLAGGTGSIPHVLTAAWDCCGGASKATKVKPT
jgi:hypothetical protein